MRGLLPIRTTAARPLVFERPNTSGTIARISGQRREWLGSWQFPFWIEIYELWRG